MSPCHVTTSYNFLVLHIQTAVHHFLFQPPSQKAHRVQTNYRFPLFLAHSCSLQRLKSLRMVSHFTSRFHTAVVLLCFTLSRTDISCRNEDGQPVDWWVDTRVIMLLQFFLVFIFLSCLFQVHHLQTAQVQDWWGWQWSRVHVPGLICWKLDDE